jgi:uncharacterized damage-inducible protein DinB
METMKWFERSFALDMPAWMYPNVVERLRGTPARVDLIVSGVRSEVLTRRDGDRWSIQENVGHLLDLEPLWIGRIDDFLAGKTRLRAADLANRKTHEASHNTADLDALLSSFRDVRAGLVRRLEDLDDSSIALSAIHPRLKKPMRVLDHIAFVAEHDDHHLAQMTRLKRRFAGR